MPVDLIRNNFDFFFNFENLNFTKFLGAVHILRGEGVSKSETVEDGNNERGVTVK